MAELTDATTPQASTRPEHLLHGSMSPTGEEPKAVVDAPRTIHSTVRDAWRGRHLLGWLAARLLIKQYARTYVGRMWLVLKPVVDTLGKALVFGGIFGVVAPDGVPYLLFVLVGMQCWILFEQGVTWATRAFDRYRKVFRDIDLPLLLIPIAVMVDGVLQFGSYTVILLLAVVGYALADSQLYLALEPGLLLAPVAVALTLLFAIALGLWLGIANAHTRDVRHGLRYVMTIWLFLTPVLYPLSDMPAALAVVAQLNPMTPPIELFKFALLGTGEVDLLMLGYSVALTLTTLVSGVWLLAKLTPWLQLTAHRTLGGEDDLTGEDDEDDLDDDEARRAPPPRRG